MKTLLTTLILLAAPLAAQSAAELVVTLHRSATIEAGYVALSAIADIEGDNAEQAGRVLLGRAPEQGEARSIEQEYIRRRLLQSGIDTNKVAFYGWAKPLVLGTNRELKATDDTGEYTAREGEQGTDAAHSSAEASAKAEARADSPVQLANTNIGVQAQEQQPEPTDIATDAMARIRRILNDQFPHHEGNLVVEEESRSRSLQQLKGKRIVLTNVASRQRTATLGRLDFELTVDADGREMRNLTLTVRAELEVQRVVSNRAHTRGDAITEFTLKTIRTSKLAEPGFSELKQATGLEAARNITPGEVLTNQNTQPALLIRRGDVVTVVAPLPGGGKVTVMADAQENGAKGDVIRLRRKGENNRENIDLLARVTASGEAEAQ
jgi:flagella basal body P-ring formation protein FlgA